MGESNQLYRANFYLRRKGEAPLGHDFKELKREDFDSSEEFWLAIASNGLEAEKADQEYIDSLEEGE